MPSHHVAQANVARLIAPLDDPRVAEFVARLDDVNAAADRWPGFVWRLQTEAGNSTAIRAFDDERIIFNLSVWETPEALKAYVYSASHLEVFRRRVAWFERPTRPTHALWWIRPGTLPTVAEGRRRLERLWSHGPGPEAFSLAAPHPPPAE